MRAVVQRVTQARVLVDGDTVGQIGEGLVVLLAVGKGDGEEEAAWMASKIAGLRIFSDAQGKFNHSVCDLAGQVLVVSQFTLYGDARKGRRPSFTEAEDPEVAERLVERVQTLLAAQGIPVAQGRFRAHMLVEIHNDGPVTILLDRPPATRA